MTPMYYHTQQQIWYFYEPGISSVVYLGKNITTLLGRKLYYGENKMRSILLKVLL